MTKIQDVKRNALERIEANKTHLVNVAVLASALAGSYFYGKSKGRQQFIFQFQSEAGDITHLGTQEYRP